MLCNEIFEHFSKLRNNPFKNEPNETENPFYRTPNPIEETGKEKDVKERNRAPYGNGTDRESYPGQKSMVESVHFIESYF